MPRLAIVIVTYNSAAEIEACLAAVSHIEDAEIVVVDNASSDNTRSLVHTRLIANSANAGFAAAVNQGVRATTAPLVLLLNPDAQYQTGIEHLLSVFADSQVGAAGGLLTDPTGRPQSGFTARNLPTPLTLAFEVLGMNRLFPANLLNRRYRCANLGVNAPSPVEQPAGAFFMFRRICWENISGFDESFWPIWFEDVDFCARLRRSGWKVFFQPFTVAKHAGGHSIHGLPLEVREKYWYGSLLRYAAKHYPLGAFTGVCSAVAVSSVVRAAKALPQHGFKAIAVYGGVIRQAFGSFLGRMRRRREALPSQRL